MNKIKILIIIIFFGCSKELSEFDLLNKAIPFGTYGEEITLTEIKKIDNLIKNSHLYLNENILISGEITEVCPMRGCWIKVKNKNSDTQIRVKVTDGEIVFPLSSKGKKVKVEGILNILNFSEEQAIQWKIHLAEEKGIKLLPENVEINSSDLIEFRIVGKAIEIY
tara:strand:+ start:817 stop:1314 length:498 start_codon:yes stop_codon:yes gene_type:complete